MCQLFHYIVFLWYAVETLCNILAETDYRLLISICVNGKLSEVKYSHTLHFTLALGSNLILLSEQSSQPTGDASHKSGFAIRQSDRC